MKYNKKFKPIKGDRVLFVYAGMMHGRIISCDETEVIIYSFLNGYFSKEIDDIRFIKECPWYKWWQQ
jgi:hypothetical protein